MILSLQKKKEAVLEDVGDIYAERKFKMPPKFSDFDLKYRRMKNVSGEEIAYKDSKVTIIKNPKTLENIGSYTRGVIDYKGNLFIEEESALIHNPLVKILNNIGVIKDIQNWGDGNPTNFITIQRQGDTNIIRIGESEDIYHVDRFQPFLNKAKIKNPGIIFECRYISNPPGIPWGDDED